MWDHRSTVTLNRNTLFDICFSSPIRALLTSGNKLPLDRRAELEQTVKLYYGVDILDEELLAETADMDTK